MKKRTPLIMTTRQSSYLETAYPRGINIKYVDLLTDYLVRNYFRNSIGFLLDIGCGRGEYVVAFNMQGFLASGVDREVDFEKDRLPFPHGSFDYIFSKSTMEHIWNTQHILGEVLRVLKPDGIVVFMVPDWERQIKCFWDDTTHIKPFTKKGLIQAFTLAGFKDIKCDYFYQLPFLWRYRWLKFVPHIINLLPVSKWKGDKQRVLIRHSKERMLLCSCVK